MLNVEGSYKSHNTNCSPLTLHRYFVLVSISVSSALEISGGNAFHSTGHHRVSENVNTDLICQLQMQTEVGISKELIRFIYINFTSLISTDDRTSNNAVLRPQNIGLAHRRPEVNDCCNSWTLLS